MLLRYYYYVSTTKVRMLSDQMVSRRPVKRSTEAGFSVKLFSAKRTVETADDTEASLLDRVIEQLHVDGEIGTVADPAGYFHGQGLMRWNVIGTPETGLAAVFAGEIEGTTVVLGGSDRHLLSAPGSDEQSLPSSSLPPVLLDRLETMSALEDERTRGLIDDVAGSGSEAETVFRAAEALDGPQQPLEFTATTLHEGHVTVDGRTRRVLLGSPLYVALRR
ncbi:DUF7019 family protein [Glycomyces sp. NPDC048151]|uniref:DUF7019 family protein n=1 Tax=Glycomyces sp. NPDC048151 TaxID=3364002 RepID=UPI0037186B3B